MKTSLRWLCVLVFVLGAMSGFGFRVVKSQSAPAARFTDPTAVLIGGSSLKTMHAILPALHLLGGIGEEPKIYLPYIDR